jgi:peroxiredoxin
LHGCSVSKSDWNKLELNALNGDLISLSKYQNIRVVFIFLSPECPLCRNYSTRINELQNEFENDTTIFVGVVGGTFYSRNEISEFLIRHKLRLPLLLDPKFELVKALNASITPEVFLMLPDGNVGYQGAIDNWAISLGQKRLAPSEHYLREALISLNQNKPISITKTSAVGCFIE